MMIDDPTGEWEAAYKHLRAAPSAEAYAAAIAVTTAQYIQGRIDRRTHQLDKLNIDALYEAPPQPGTCPQED